MVKHRQGTEAADLIGLAQLVAETLLKSIRVTLDTPRIVSFRWWNL